MPLRSGNAMKDILPGRNTPKGIISNRNAVRKRLLEASSTLKGGIVDQITIEDLRLLFSCYDQVFFKGGMTETITVPLKFSLSSRMSKAAGKTLVRYRPGDNKTIVDIEIRIGTTFLFQHHLLSREKSVAGIKTRDGVDALQRVFEHELCHVLEYCFYGTSNCNQQRFKDLAGQLFGHTDTHHQLPTNQEIAHQTYGLKAGDSVSFDFENRYMQGLITHIEKRATVMVPDPKGLYKNGQGTRYTKYYVPLTLLQRI